MQIQYPLYLIPLEAGYVSVVEPESGDDQTYYLAVFTDQELAETFMKECGIDGDPKPLRNAREFAWLMQSLRAPISNLAFDPLAGAKSVEARWKVSVQEVLDKHIIADFSPWNYPVFLIEQSGGFACIEGQTSAGEQMRAIGLFTTEEKALQFLKDADETGMVRPLEDMSQTRAFLQSVSANANAMAIDLTVDGNQRRAEYCFSIKTILEKYLVHQ